MLGFSLGVKIFISSYLIEKKNYDEDVKDFFFFICFIDY